MRAVAVVSRQAGVYVCVRLRDILMSEQNIYIESIFIYINVSAACSISRQPHRRIIIVAL